MLRRALLVLAAVAVSACAHAPAADIAAARAALAPAGVLRVGVNVGSPTSYIVNKQGRETGLTLDLARKMGAELGVPVEVIKYDRIAPVMAGIQVGRIDMTFTNATEDRAKEVNFSPPIMRVELGYLVAPSSRISDASQVDAPGVRLGVSDGSASHRMLQGRVKSARMVPATSLSKGAEMLKAGEIDVYTTNKAILFEMSDQVPGSRVLPGGWATENLAIAYPKGREVGAAYLADFARRMRGSAELKDMRARAGVRGALDD
jgi:polar amino acid transport system substrate-binding protein